MPVVSCPKCTTGLRVPDGATASVRCPKCQTVFQPPQPKPAARPPAPPRPAPRPAAPAPSADFEVVEESPPPAPKSPPAGPKKAFSLDEAVRSADPPRTRRTARDDDRDRDDRDRDRRRRDEEDDEDRRRRGRSGRTRDDYGDDDDDRRRRDDDDYDDDYDDRRDRGRRPSRFGVARPGVLLILISVGLYFGGMALHALFLFLAWVGAVIPNGLVVITGVLGLAGWVVALVGFGLSIAGPAKARGLAIAATAVAVVHLVLAIVVANDRQSILFGSHSVLAMSAVNRVERIQDLNKELIKEMQANPGGPRAKSIQAELAGYGGDRSRVFGDGLDGMRWDDLITNLPRLDKLIAVLVYSSQGFEYYLWGLFAGLFELARLVLLGLLLGALARAAKDHRAADQAKFGWIAGAVAVGVGMLVVLLAAVMAKSAAEDMAKGFTADFGGGPPVPQFTPGVDLHQQMAERQRQMDDWRRQQETAFERQQQRFRSLQRSVKNWSAGGELLVFTLHAGALILPGLSAFGVFQSMGRRR